MGGGGGRRRSGPRRGEDTVEAFGYAFSSYAAVSSICALGANSITLVALLTVDVHVPHSALT